MDVFVDAKTTAQVLRRCLTSKVSKFEKRHNLKSIRWILSTDGRGPSDDAWAAILKDGALSAILDLLLEGDLFGYTKGFIRSWNADTAASNQEDILYAANLVEVHSFLADSMQNIREKDMNGFRQATRDEVLSILPRYPRFWRIMHELRIPLVAAFEALGENRDTAVCIAVGAQRQVSLEQEFGVVPQNFDQLLVLLHVWATSKSLTARKISIFHVFGSTSDRTETEDPTAALYQSLAKEAFATTISQETFTKCMCRELKRESHIDGEYETTTAALMFFRAERMELPRSFSSRYDRLLFQYALATSRRQSCRGTRSGFHADRILLCYVLSVMNTIVRMPLTNKQAVERYMHAVIAYVANIFVDLCTATDKDVSCFMDVIITRCSTVLAKMHLRINRTPIPPELNVLRRWSIRRHGQVLDAIKDMRLNHGSARDSARAWEQLGTQLPRAVHGDTWSFPSYERCGWIDCPCSVHKPAHQLRMCAGCWRVAYCGKKCQDRDWIQGHRNLCSHRKT